MIRLLGAITGSALALAALLVLVGVPQFKAAPKAEEPERVMLPLRAEPLAPVIDADKDAADVPVAATQAADPVAAAAEPVATSAAESGTDPVVEPAAMPPLAEDIEEAQETVVELLQAGSPQWYAFWSPFRSEIAASGFVSRLQSVTGLDFRVIKLKPGVYEVAFAYATDDDIPLNLSQISAATGLDLPGN